MEWHARWRSYSPPTRKSLRKSQRLPRSAPPPHASPHRQRHRICRPPYHRARRLTHKHCRGLASWFLEMDLPALPYSAHGRPSIAAKASQAFAANAAEAVAKAVVRQLEFKRRARLRRPSSLRLTRPLRGEISQRFGYLRDLPPASSEYRPQSARRGDEADHVRLQPTAWLENRELLLSHYWTTYPLA